MRARTSIKSGRRPVTSGIFLAVIAMAALLVGAAPASAQNYTVRLENQNTTRCLTWDYGVGAGTCEPTRGAVFFYVHYWNDGSLELRGAGTDYCLDDSFAFGLRVFGCNALTYQSWYRIDRPNGWHTYENQATGRCIDDSFAFGPRAYACNGLSYQNFAELL